jgi:phage terminase Nu1 subunit (DNA packaging protein)
MQDRGADTGEADSGSDPRRPPGESVLSSLSVLVPIGLAAQLLGFGERQVTKLVARGFVRRHGRGLFRLEELVQGAARYWRDQARRGSQMSDAQAELVRAKARALELRIAHEEDKVIDVELAEEVVAAQASECINELHSVAKCIPRARFDRALLEELEAWSEAAHRRIFERLKVRLDKLQKGEGVG